MGKKIRIPSGAIIGLDNLKIGQISPPEKLLLRTTKPPRRLGWLPGPEQRYLRGLRTIV